jgi:hypothetical protein
MRTSLWGCLLYDVKLVSDYYGSFNVLSSCITYITTLIFLDLLSF